MRAAVVLFGALAGLAHTARPVSAQPLATSSGALATQARDSAAVVRRARTLQARFESKRRLLLPRYYSGAADRCVIIGRFCYWSSGTAIDAIPAEGDDIRRARAQLLSELETIAALAPGDDWIVGQRIRYLVESRDTSATRVARDCAATRWWCDALTGYALHVSGDFAAADSVFAVALAGMPSAVRCEWVDISKLLGSELRKEYRRLPCAQREARMSGIWWLADPLLMTPGNERRTEHFSRVLYAALQKNAANTHGISWGRDLAELVVRFGWPEKWTRKPEGNSYGAERASVAGHDREPGFHFFPARHASGNLEPGADSIWELDRALPEERYSPAYARTFAGLDAQVARFRRGDSTLVVAAYDVSRDTLFRGRRFTAALVSATNDTIPPAVRAVAEAPVAHVMTLKTAGESRLVGVELLAGDSAAAARWRSGYPEIPLDPGRFSISDLLFVDGGDTLPENLDAAIPRTHGGTVFSRTEKVGLFWELYGKVPLDSAVPISLTISPLDGGFLRTALRALRIAPRATPLNIRWQENGASGLLSARSLLLDLSLVPPGKYEVKLEVGAVSPAAASRTIRIR